MMISNKGYSPNRLKSHIEWTVMILFGGIYYWTTYLWHYDPSGLCPPGYLGPGGLHLNRTLYNCTGGAAHALDLLIFGQNHIYQRATCQELYNPSGPYYVEISHDPEGLLGCCTSIILAFIGLQFGKSLLEKNQPNQETRKWIVWSIILAILSSGLHFSGYEPIIKNLWTFSYIFSTGSLAFLVMSVLYYVIDVQNYWLEGYPFQYIGQNSLALYFGSEMLANSIPWSFKVDSAWHLPHLTMNLWTTFLWTVIGIYMAKKKIFMSV